jgi:hypothetical protein
MTVEATQATQAVVQFIVEMVNNPALALQFAKDPNGTLAVQGVSEHDLSGVDMPAAIAEACGTPGFPADAASALQSYTSGGGGGGGGYQPPPPAHGPQPVEHVVQQLQYVNYVTHENNTNIQQTILDQSTTIGVGDNFSGEIDIDNVSASGEGSVAAGEGSDVAAATGDNSQVIDDSIVGQNQNNSAGAVQVGEDNNAPIVTGTNTGVVNDGDINAPVLANSSNSGVIADGDVDRTIVGDNNEQTNVDVGDDVDGVLSFGGGSGDITNVNDSTVTDSAVGGGDNVSNNTLSDASVLNTGSGNVNVSDDDTTTTTTENTNVNANNSVVSTEQGPGDNDSFDNSFQDNDVLDLDAGRLPVVLDEQPARSFEGEGDNEGDQPLA